MAPKHQTDNIISCQKFPLTKPNKILQEDRQNACACYYVMSYVSYFEYNKKNILLYWFNWLILIYIFIVILLHENQTDINKYGVWIAEDDGTVDSEFPS